MTLLELSFLFFHELLLSMFLIWGVFWVLGHTIAPLIRDTLNIWKW